MTIIQQQDAAVPASTVSSQATVSDLMNRVRVFLEDQGGKWTDYNFLLGYVQAANEDLNTELAAYNLSYGTQVVVLSAVPANTANLDSYMAEDGLLEGIEQPVTIEWRIAGTDDSKWRAINEVDAVLDAVDLAYPKSWEWRGESVYLSPCNQAIDLRLRCDRITVPVSDASDGVIRGALNILAYKTAELVAGARGGLAGTGEPLAKYLERKGEIAKENFEQLCTKRDQAKRRRFGRSNRRGVAMNFPVPGR